MTKVSIVIPIYNGEKYIGQCIKSVLRQTLKELEIICIDDGSTDNSAHIVQTLRAKDARIRLFRQENQGAGAARNFAIQKAKGTYIAFLDSDDYYLDENALEIMLYMCETQSLSVCGSLRKHRREGLEEYEETETLFQGVITDKLLEYRDYQLDYNYQSFLFLKSHLVENKIFFPDYRRYQDPPFLVRALYQAGEFAVADTYLYCYRVSDMTPRFNPQKVKDLLHGLMDNLQFAQEHELEILFQNTVHRLEDEYVDIICRNLLLDELDMLQLLINVNQIINRFYDRKSYVIQPLRTLVFGINQYSYRKALIDKISRKSKIALYGAGKYGKLFFLFLKQNHLQNKVVCFVVSDLRGNPSEIEGVPVVILNEFLQQKRSCIFITVRGGIREEVKQILDRNKYDEYEIIQEEFLHVIAVEVE